MYRRHVLFPVVMVLLSMVAMASVFVYYPLTITAQPTAPGVVFRVGSNADQSDIGENTITVDIGENGASASVKIHPTYQDNYYWDILQIYNGDDDSMNIYIIFESVTNKLPSGSVVKMFVYLGNNKVGELDITDPYINSPIEIGKLEAGATWQIDFYVYIPEGSDINDASYTARANLVYTPSDETPPVKPSGGR